jgi:hypothetical protein
MTRRATNGYALCELANLSVHQMQEQLEMDCYNLVARD